MDRLVVLQGDITTQFCKKMIILQCFPFHTPVSDWIYNMPEWF